MSQRKNRRRAQKQQQRQWIIGGVVLIVAIAGVLVALASTGSSTLRFSHIHGMSYSGDGELLRVASHEGLRLYDSGSWEIPDMPANDYMGYSGTADGFFSSGHPGINSNLVNPLGVLRSTDGGATLTTVNFGGESDFHTMGASYYGETVYVVNPIQNSQLSPGMHYSLDGGQTWQQSQASGLTSAPIQVAVHPDDPAIVAAATQNGLLLSEDYGDTFLPIGSGGVVTGVAFDPDGTRLLYGYQQLFAYALEGGEDPVEINTPSLADDNVIYFIAANPENNELAISTAARDIYVSGNDGNTWKQVMEDGVTK